MSDILDTIDNALADCAVSGDAMRWTPDAQGVADPGSDSLPTIYRDDAAKVIARLCGIPPNILGTDLRDLRLDVTPDVMSDIFAAYRRVCEIGGYRR